eukprot:3908082-Prymnesium_polylepis.2
MRRFGWWVWRAGLHSPADSDDGWVGPGTVGDGWACGVGVCNREHVGRRLLRDRAEWRLTEISFLA